MSDRDQLRQIDRVAAKLAAAVSRASRGPALSLGEAERLVRDVLTRDLYGIDTDPEQHDIDVIGPAGWWRLPGL